MLSLHPLSRKDQKLEDLKDITRMSNSSVYLLGSVQLFCDCSPAGSSVRGISQARILEWVATSFSRRSSQPRDQTQVSLHCRWVLYHLSHKGSLSQ